MNDGVRRASPVVGVIHQPKPNEILAFAVAWGKTEAVSGDRIGIAASTQNKLVMNAMATVTIFQLSGIHETPIGAPISAQVGSGNLSTIWVTRNEQAAGDYHVKVSVMVGGKTYVGRTKFPLKLRKDGLIQARPDYSKLTGG